VKKVVYFFIVWIVKAATRLIYTENMFKRSNPVMETTFQNRSSFENVQLEEKKNIFRNLLSATTNFLPLSFATAKWPQLPAFFHICSISLVTSTIKCHLFWCSVISTATWLRAGRSGVLIGQEVFLFSNTSRPAPGLTQHRIQWI